MGKALALQEDFSAEPPRPGWIRSPPFDLSFLILSPVAGFGLALLAVQHSSAMPAVLFISAYLLAIPHYLASFAFFLGDENREYARRLWFLFYAMPLAICACVAIFYTLAAAAVVHAVIFLWNIYHVASQSSGVLSLYRRLSGGTQAERGPAHKMIIFTNAAMALWNMEGFAPLRDPLVALHPALPRVAFFSCLALAVGFGAAYARALSRRGFPLSVGESCSLGTALLIFAPYLWIADMNFATLTMLVGHFIQYLAIVWLLNRRKYSVVSGSTAQRWLARMGRSWTAPVAFIVLSGSLFFLFERATQAMNVYMGFMIIFNSLALVHFYLDGLIWAFRTPYSRRTVGPFLTLESSRLR
jgi:hypothetical protein